MVALLQQEKPPRYLALSGSQATYINSGATAHIMQDDFILTGAAAQLSGTVEIAGKDTINAKTHCKSTVKMSAGQK